MDLAKLLFKVIFNCSSWAELCAWNSTSMAPGQHFSHHLSKLSVARQSASKSDGRSDSLARKVIDLKCYPEEGRYVLNCLLFLQKVAFCILDKQYRSTPVGETFFKCGKWICAYVFNWIWCRVPRVHQVDRTVGLCKSLPWWNLVAIAANQTNKWNTVECSKIAVVWVVHICHMCED